MYMQLYNYLIETYNNNLYIERDAIISIACMYFTNETLKHSLDKRHNKINPIKGLHFSFVLKSALHFDPKIILTIYTYMYIIL